MPTERPFVRGATGALFRLSITLGIWSAVLGGPAPAAPPSVLPDLPLEVRPAAASVYAEAAVVGSNTYVCGTTDILGWTWLPYASQAQLFDAAKNELGRYSGRTTMMAPRIESEIVWEDTRGGRIVATRAASGRLPGDKTRTWTRYDVQSSSGDGPFAAIRHVMRISAAREDRPDQPCNQALFGARIDMPFQAIDLLVK